MKKKMVLKDFMKKDEKQDKKLVKEVMKKDSKKMMTKKKDCK
jgi:hypothetical protein